MAPTSRRRTLRFGMRLEGAIHNGTFATLLRPVDICGRFAVPPVCAATHGSALPTFRRCASRENSKENTAVGRNFFFFIFDREWKTLSFDSSADPCDTNYALVGQLRPPSVATVRVSSCCRPALRPGGPRSTENRGAVCCRTRCDRTGGAIDAHPPVLLQARCPSR